MRPADILIVDDSATSRAKLAAAVRALGHRTVEAGDGQNALGQLGRSRFDAVLLDIVMPGLSGFDVLHCAKENAATRDIPIIVVSSLEDDLASVVQAIELGAEDFLAKDFDPVLLRARLNACLERKWFRDQEVEYLHQLGRLTRAAEILEKGRFDPARLGLEAVSARTDSLGRLARVFTDMARQVYERERQLRRNIRTLKGVIALVSLGIIWGLVVPVARLASTFDAPVFGMVFWTNLIGASICGVITVLRGKFPKLRDLRWRFFLLWAILGTLASETLLFWVTANLAASTVAIILVVEGFFVFAFAALIRIEEPTMRRLAGLLFGMIGVLVVLADNSPLTAGSSDFLWIFVALAIPGCYAFESVYIAAKRPEGIDLLASLMIMQCLAAMIVLPVTLATGSFFPLGPWLGGRETAVALISIGTVVSNYLYVYLLATTGAVFASQSAYVVAAAGVAWSVVLLDERLTVWGWGAMVVILAGLLLVGPKSEAEQEQPLPA